MPACTAEGDLDGDLYYVLWSKKLLGEFKESWTAPVAPSVKEQPSGPAASAPKGLGISWYVKAQEHLSDPSLLSEGKFIGKLYKEMEKLAEEYPEGMYHPDCEALGRAYKEAIDSKKHSLEIGSMLPAHLRERVGLKV